MIILISMDTRITLFHFNDLHGNYLVRTGGVAAPEESVWQIEPGR